MAEQRPKVEFTDNVTEQVTLKFNSEGKSGTGQYGAWFLWTVEYNGEDASLFADDKLQDLLESCSPERGVQLAIRKDKPKGEKYSHWKVWRHHEGEWVAIDVADNPSRRSEAGAAAPETPQKPSEAPKQSFAKAGTRPDLLSPVMAECLNQAAINYGYGSWFEALQGDEASQERLDAIQRLAQSLFIAATDGRTVLPAPHPLSDYEGPEAPTEQTGGGVHPESQGGDDLPFAPSVH